MKLLNVNIATWYKAIHVFFASTWFGGVLAVILIYLFTDLSGSVDLVKNNARLIEVIDQYLIIPSSVICYGFGIILSWKTSWGFLKYKWIVVKLVLGSSLMLFGIVFLGPWILESSSTDSMTDFIQIQEKLGVSMIVQAFVIAITILISTIKPWGKIQTK